MMSSLDQFENISTTNAPLGEGTWLKVGGSAKLLIEPTSIEELQSVVKAAAADEVPLSMLGSGSNILVRDEGVSGAVLKLSHDAFHTITIDGETIRAAGGALLSAVISQSVAAGLAGIEELVGIPGTIGGAAKGNAGGRHADIGEFITEVTVMTATGEVFTRSGDALSFEYRNSSINELVVLEVVLQLKTGQPEEIAERMRTTWITKKATQPLSFQSAGCIFKNPRGMSAGALIEKAGLKGTKLGEAEVSDRHANFIVTNDGATATDVLKLIEVIRKQVHEAHGVELELEIKVW